MRFYPPNKVVPVALKTAEFILRPLTSAHVELDYEALMVSREMLRLWSGSEWPADDFTPADNLQDLERHEREHLERVAFTYTVLNTAETECLGCVYINPLARLKTDNPAALAAIGDDEAIVSFWVRQPRLVDDCDQRLLATLIDWFPQAWSFSQVLFFAREQDRRQIQLLAQSPLKHRYNLTVPQRGDRHQFYGYNDS